MRVFDAPRGRGPYGITATSDGTVWYASLAGSHIARVDAATGAATVIEPPTAGQGARRVWADSRGPDLGQRMERRPGRRLRPGHRRTGGSGRCRARRAQAYSVYVDDRDLVWLTDFGGNAIVVFDPVTEQFTSLELETPGAAVRQMLGRPGEVWGAESAADKLVVVRLVYS